jgi:hypothetical protein
MKRQPVDGLFKAAVPSFWQVYVLMSKNNDVGVTVP